MEGRRFGPSEKSQPIASSPDISGGDVDKGRSLGLYPQRLRAHGLLLLAAPLVQPMTAPFWPREGALFTAIASSRKGGHLAPSRSRVSERLVG